MKFVQSSKFIKEAAKLIGDEEVGKLKLSLYGNPEAGVVIPRQKGLRKLRWAAKGKGKRA